MKKSILIVILMVFSLCGYAQSKSVAQLYEKHKGNENFFHMDLGGNFMNMAKGFDIKLDEGSMQSLASQVEKIRLFKLPYGGHAAKADFSTLQKGLSKEKFEVMMEMSEKNNGIVLYSKGENIIHDLVLLINGKDGDYMVVELLGQFDSKSIEEAGTKAMK